MSSCRSLLKKIGTMVFHKQGDGGRPNSITTCCYHKSVVYYSRTVANSSRRDMLFSSGDFLRTLSSILSGEGFDEREQGKSPLAILDLIPPSRFLRPQHLHHFRPRINSKTFEKYFELLAIRKANLSDIQSLRLDDKLRLVRAAAFVSFMQI
jgi:hypothetical protein